MVLEDLLPSARVVVVLVPGQPEELAVGFVVTLTTRIEAMAAAACAVDRGLIWPGIVFRAVRKVLWTVDGGFE